MDGCPEACEAKDRLLKPEPTHKGDTEVRLMAPVRSKKVSKEKPKPKRPKRLEVGKGYVLETDNVEEPNDEQGNDETLFDPEKLARLQATTPVTQIGGKGTPRHSITRHESLYASLCTQGDRLFTMAGYTYSTELAEAEAKSKPAKTLEEMIPEQYGEHMHVFLKAESERLPEHKPHDHAIKLTPEAKGFHAKVYPLSQNEQVELDKFLKENLEKGYIQPSKSPMASL